MIALQNGTGFSVQAIAVRAILVCFASFKVLTSAHLLIIFKPKTKL